MHEEDRIQSASWQWLWNAHPKTRRLFYAIPNGGRRTIIEAKRLQATGTVPGMPDTHLTIPAQGYHSAYIEFKTPEGELSEAQIKCHKALLMAGHLVVIKRTVEDFKSFIYDYLKDTGYLNVTT